MSPLSKVLYPSLILLLTWLAVAPHWPAMRKEAENFYTAWQQIRSSGVSEPAATQEASPAEKESRRERAIAPPKPVAELPRTNENKASAAALDPFMREARERAKEDPAAAMQWLQEQSMGTERLRAMLEVVALWAAKDSESALLWLESNAQGLARLETLNRGVELWAQRDPEATAGWIDGMANDQSKISAARSLTSAWARTNPTAAATWLNQLPNGPVREEAAQALALSWMESDPARAAAWANAEYGRSGQHAILHQVIEKYTQLDPDAAESFVRSVQVGGPLSPKFLEKYVEARAANDPLATANWVKALPQNDALHHTEHAATLMRVWAETDSIAASSWLSDQPLGPQRDAAIAGFAQSIQRFEPEAAATWANSISNPDQRMQKLNESIRRWAADDPQSALGWVIDAELEPALQEQLAREIGID